MTILGDGGGGGCKSLLARSLLSLTSYLSKWTSNIIKNLYFVIVSPTNGIKFSLANSSLGHENKSPPCILNNYLTTTIAGNITTDWVGFSKEVYLNIF